jgi:hypothetical protein
MLGYHDLDGAHDTRIYESITIFLGSINPNRIFRMFLLLLLLKKHSKNTVEIDAP